MNMPIMTLPLWIFILSVGTPSLCLLMLVVGLLRRKRKERRLRAGLSATLPAAPKVFGQNIHQHILVQQIDSIFNALVAVIEAERVKLKALAMNASFQVMSAQNPARPVQIAAQESSENETDEDLGQTAVAMASDGMPAEQIARVLGLSQHEVALALKMHGTIAKRRLDAVA
jgi:hypothetical protein